jgi:hypothetical protein
VVAHLNNRHKKWPAIFRNCYLYGPVPKITILKSAHLRGRYQKARRSLVSIVLTRPLLIIDYWYRRVSPPILISAIVTSRYQYWIQCVIIDRFSSRVYYMKRKKTCVCLYIIFSKFPFDEMRPCTRPTLHLLARWAILAYCPNQPRRHG